MSEAGPGHEAPTIELIDSRRLTGANLVGDRAGAVIDGTLAGLEPGLFRDAWRSAVGDALTAVGWEADVIQVYLVETKFSHFLGQFLFCFCHIS